MTKWFWDGMAAIARVFVESGHPYIVGGLVALGMLLAGVPTLLGAAKLILG